MRSHTAPAARSRQWGLPQEGVPPRTRVTCGSTHAQSEGEGGGCVCEKDSEREREREVPRGGSASSKDREGNNSRKDLHRWGEVGSGVGAQGSGLIRGNAHLDHASQGALVNVKCAGGACYEALDACCALSNHHCINYFPGVFPHATQALHRDP